MYRADFVLEGGSIDVDGQGTVLTTEECLLNHNRNPELTREDRAQPVRVPRRGQGHLAPRGVYLDETDGHVDNFARFGGAGGRHADLDR